MRRFVWLVGLPLVVLAAAAGCSNRPLAGLMDNLFPSRGGSRAPRDPSRPTDRDPLPLVPGFDPTPSGGDGFRREDLPRGPLPPLDGYRREDVPRDRALPPLDGYRREDVPRGPLPPLGAPITPARRDDASWQPRPGGGAMPLPGNG